MAEKIYGVTVYMVNEGEHQPSQVSFDATGVTVEEDGSLRFDTPQGGRHYGATTWGGFKFIRVEGRL